MTQICRTSAILLLSLSFLAGCAGKPPEQIKIGASTLNVATTALAGGDPQMALNVTNAVLKDHPRNVDALVDQGDAYYEMHICQKAIPAYNTALSINPHTAGAEIGLGRCLMNSNPKGAVAAFTAATQDNPQDAKAFNDLGIANDEIGEIPQANQAFRQALAIDPTMRAAKVNYGFSLALGGEPQKAQAILGPLAMAPNATPRIRQDYAAALAIGGNMNQAQAVLTQDMSPADAQALITQFQNMAAQIATSQQPAAISTAAPAPAATPTLTATPLQAPTANPAPHS